MINVIIFSFDRAMQLALLLKSICRYDVNKSFNVSVLYSYSGQDYQKAYARLQSQYSQFNWIEETIYNQPEKNFDFDFFYWHNIYWWLVNKKLRKNRSNFKSIILQILSQSKNEFAMFLTDDSLFYREIQIPQPQFQKLREFPLIHSFSLRHGAHLDGGLYYESSDIIQWNVYRNDFSTDWGFPFSIDGHIYEKETIQQIIERIVFNNPNTMEGNIACFIKEKKYFSQITAMKDNSLVGFELNQVQTVTTNHHLDISQEELNRYFLNGYYLRIEFDETDIKHFRPRITHLTVHKENKKNILL
jgi:hypothetical protein